MGLHPALRVESSGKDDEGQEAEHTLRAPRENRFIWRDGDLDLFDEDEADTREHQASARGGHPFAIGASGRLCRPARGGRASPSAFGRLDCASRLISADKDEDPALPLAAGGASSRLVRRRSGGEPRRRTWCQAKAATPSLASLAMPGISTRSASIQVAVVTKPSRPRPLPMSGTESSVIAAMAAAERLRPR